MVVAAGLGSGALLGDDAPMPARGQVALLANPGLDRWVVDDEHPDGMVYALPHPGWVVCGGTDVAGAWDTRPDPVVHAAIVTPLTLTAVVSAIAPIIVSVRPPGVATPGATGGR